MYIKKDQNKLEIYLKNKLLKQNFFIFIRTALVNKYTFLKKKDIFLNQLNFLNISNISNISNLKAPLGIQHLSLFKKQNNFVIYIIKNNKTIFKKKNNYYFNKIIIFFKIWFIKKNLNLNKILYKNL